LWKIGNGLSVSLWFDHWLLEGPLDQIIPHPLIETSDLPKHAVVADLLSLMGASFGFLLQSRGFSIPISSSASDRFLWSQTPTGSFSVASAWDCIRTQKTRYLGLLLSGILILLLDSGLICG